MAGKIRSPADLFASAKSGDELLGYVIAYLAGYACTGRGINAAQLNELCEAINSYYEARQSARG